MKRETLFLKLAIFVIGVPILLLIIFGIRYLIMNPFNSDYARILYPIVIGICLSAIPFYFSLYKAFNLLNYIDKNIAFSNLSVNALKNIKYCAITICCLYVVMMPFFYIVADKDDAPGLIIISMIPVFASMVIAVFAAVLQKLLKNAIEIKTENDLTV